MIATVLLLPSINLEASGHCEDRRDHRSSRESRSSGPLSWVLGEKHSKPEAEPRIIRQQVNAEDFILKEKASAHCLCPPLLMLCPPLLMYDVSTSFWSSSGMVMEPNSKLMTVTFDFGRGDRILDTYGNHWWRQVCSNIETEQEIAELKGRSSIPCRSIPSLSRDSDIISPGHLHSPKYPAQVINRYRVLKCICMAFSPLHQLTFIRRSNIITPEENNPTVQTDSGGVNMRKSHFYSQLGPSYSMKTSVGNPSVSSSWFQKFLFTYILV